MARRIQPPPSPLGSLLGVGLVASLAGALLVSIQQLVRRSSGEHDLDRLLASRFFWTVGEIGLLCAESGAIAAWIGALALFRRPGRNHPILDALACLVLTAPFTLVLSELIPVPHDAEWVFSPTLARLGTPVLVGWLAALAWRLRPRARATASA